MYVAKTNNAKKKRNLELKHFWLPHDYLLFLNVHFLSHDQGLKRHLTDITMYQMLREMLKTHDSSPNEATISQFRKEKCRNKRNIR